MMDHFGEHFLMSKFDNKMFDHTTPVLTQQHVLCARAKETLKN